MILFRGPKCSNIHMHKVVQELGREGILPYPSFFASNRPFNAPLAGLFTQYVVSCTFMLAPPPGDAYLFMISSKTNTMHPSSSQLIPTHLIIQCRHIP